MSCPNKNLKDWGDLVDRFGEETAYYIFIKNGDKVPYLQGRESNRFIWNVENSLKLVEWKNDNGKNTKVPKTFDNETANNYVQQIKSDYIGDFTVKAIPSGEGSYIKLEGKPLVKHEVDEYQKDTTKDGSDLIESYEQYKVLQDQEKGIDSFEDVLPLNLAEQSYILYDKEIAKENEFTDNRISDDILVKSFKDVMPKIEEVVIDNKIDDSAKFENGKVIINNDNFKTVGQALIDIRGGIADKFVATGVDLIKGTDLYTKIEEENKDLIEDEISKMALEQAIKSESMDIFSTTEASDKFEHWLNRYFKWISVRTGMTKVQIRNASGDNVSTPTGDLTDQEWSNKIEGTESQEEKNKTQKIMDSLIDEYSKIRSKATKIVQERIDKARRSGRLEDIGDLEDVLLKLEDDLTKDKKAIIMFVKNASDLINREYMIYNTNRKEEANGDPEAFSIRLLTRWHDMLTSYDVLDDILSLLPDESFLGTEGALDKSTTNMLKYQLQDIIAKKNKLRDQYINRGTDKITEALNRYSGRLKIQTKEEKRREWRKNNKNKKYSKEEAIELQNKYAEDYIKKNITEIVKQSKQMIKGELSFASEGDVNLITMWLDTMLDTNDMVMAAMTKKIVVHKGLVHEDTKTFKDQAWPIVQELYKEANYTWGKTDLVKVYDFMLEKDKDGKRTGHIISKFTSALSKEYAAEKRRNSILPHEEARKKNFEWWNKNNPLDTKARDEALQKYMEQLVETGDIKQEDITIYYENQKIPSQFRPPLWKVFNEDSTNGSLLIERWKKENNKDFRQPIDKWKNREWSTFSKFMEDNPNSPKTKFYKLIQKNIEDTNKGLPGDKKRYDELPFTFKDTIERVVAGQKVKDVSKDAFQRLVERRIDEEGKGMYTDMNDKPIDFVPYHYTRPTGTHKHKVTYKLKVSEDKAAIAAGKGKEFKTKTRYVIADTAEEAIQKTINNTVGIDPDSVRAINKEDIQWSDEDQSYDLMGAYYKYFKMANNFRHMNEIVPEVDLVKRLSEQRDYAVKDSRGNTVFKKLGLKSERPVTKKGVNANLVKMFDHFVKTTMYGQGHADEGSFDMMGWKFDSAKFRDNLNKYSSYTMLGLNVMQAVSNVSLGELQQIIEAHAGEFLNKKDLHKATVLYGKEMPGMLGDVGMPSGSSVVTHLNEKWDILNEYDNPDYKKNNKFSKLISSSTLFFMAHAGEHFMQTRIMLAMLSKKRAFDKEGNDIGSMYDMYSVKDGQLTLSDKVDLEKSDWGEEQQILFGAKVKRLLAKLHGEYSDLGKNAAQRYSIGRMGMLFRKFIVPGVKRRWQKKQINEFLEEYTEGSYRSMFSFIGRAFSETRALGFASFTENWKEMSPREQSNIIRGVSELGLGIMIAILASAFLTLKGESDDDKEKYLLSLGAYIAGRVKSEFFFYVDPSSTMTILKSPAVATTMIESVLKLGSQIVFDPFATYERDSWKDQPKVLKSLMRLTPAIKQYYKVRDVEDSLIFFQR